MNEGISKMEDSQLHDCGACSGCEPDRREFMKEVARVAVLLLVPLTWRTGVALANGELKYPV
ncbi:MAG TPA: hypothetical protein VF021_11205, partial [Longimicrobiales bacterium]